jgi:two-component system sensor histidine kinase PilS (NtrC family)
MDSTQVFGQQGLRLIQTKSDIQRESIVNFVHGSRAVLLFAVLTFIVVFQLFQVEFINVSVWLPVYISLFPVFLVNSVYFMKFDSWNGNQWMDWTLFALDVMTLSLLVHFTGTDRSIFVVPLLIVISLSGLILPKWLLLGLLSLASAFYSMSLLADVTLTGGTLYTDLFFNNMAILGIGFLSHVVGREIFQLGSEVTRSRAKIETLETLNTLVVNNIASGLVTVNSNNIVTTSNTAAGSILETSDMNNRHLSNVFPEVYRQIMGLENPLSKGQVLRLEIELERDDKIKIVEGLVSPLVEVNGESKGHLFLFQDLTDLKQMEKQVRQQDKLAAVGQLAAGIAHEIRNPLASISGSIQLLVGTPENLKDEDLKLMRIVLREIDRLNELISEFLEFVRPETMGTDLVDLNGLLTEVMEMVRFNKSLPDGVNHEMAHARNASVLGNRDKLKQAFLNIVINSYQAMADTETKNLHVGLEKFEDKIIVTVSDTGCGMDKKTLNRIFEPFLTTKPKGTGLGLAITHKILESHGAKVDVLSEVNEGTRFRIEFDARMGDVPKEDMQEKQA